MQVPERIRVKEDPRTPYGDCYTVGRWRTPGYCDKTQPIRNDMV